MPPGPHPKYVYVQPNPKINKISNFQEDRRIWVGGQGGTCPPWDFLRDPSGPGFEVAGSNFYRKSILL